jgi:hypothetical protein
VTPTTLTFTCSICGEPSVSICVYCTKDGCPNHLCERCLRCSDCCECELRLDEHPEHELAHAAVHEPTIEEIGIVEIVEDIPIDGHGATAPETTVGEPPETHESFDQHDTFDQHRTPEPHPPEPHNPEPHTLEPHAPQPDENVEPQP